MLPSLLEKALAKFVGVYSNLNTGNSSFNWAMSTLTSSTDFVWPQNMSTVYHYDFM